MLKRILAATSLALVLSPLVGWAQSSGEEPNTLCFRACTVEHENAVRACANASDPNACVQQADGAFSTCMAWCPENKK
jgi:hypothetical protein